MSKILCFDGKCYIRNAIVMNGDEGSNPTSIDLSRISLKKCRIFSTIIFCLIQPKLTGEDTPLANCFVRLYPSGGKSTQ
jgi:hypothetical protein